MERKLLPWLDIAKCFCAAGVLYIHTEPLKQIAPAGNGILLCFSHGGVALFFLLSGFLFASGDGKPDFRQAPGRMLHFVRRVLRLYLVWALPWLWVYVVIFQQPADFWQELFFGIWHLWFLTGLLQVMVILYVWQRFFAGIRLLPCSVAVFVLGTFLSTYTGYVAIDLTYWHFLRNGIFYGLVFFLLGMYMAQDRASACLGTLRKLLLPAVLIQIAEAVLLGSLHGYGVCYDFYLGQLLLAPALLAFLLKLPDVTGGWPSGTVFLRRVSTLFYCMHELLLVCWCMLAGMYADCLASWIGVDRNVLNFCLIGVISAILSCLLAYGRKLERRLDWLM